MLSAIEGVLVKEFAVSLDDRGTIYAELWIPEDKENIKDVVLIWIHWMDSRGFSESLELYPNFAKYFAQKGYPVILYDQLGSGKSTGLWEFPKKQADQFITVAKKGLTLIVNEIPSLDANKLRIIGIGHSLGGVTLMHAIERGFHMPMGFFVSVPPSHGFSIKKGYSKRYGVLKYWTFLLLSYIDPILEKVRKPLYFNFFGFKVRLKDIRKEMMTSHAALMAIKHPEIPIIAIFGDNDEYISLDEIKRFLPEGKYPWIKRIILHGATHSMLTHQKDLFKIVEQHIEELENSKNI